MELKSIHSQGSRVETWIALALCAAVVSGWTAQHLVGNRPDYAGVFAPDWLALVAAGIASAGTLLSIGRQLLPRLRGALLWSGLLLMVWTANGLPFDLLRLTPLMPPGLDWPGMATRAAAIAAAVMLARLVMADLAEPASIRKLNWYGYAAFAFALPYPFFRTWWALGGTPGLMWPGAAGHGFEAWLFSIPWLLAAVLSLLLVSKSRGMPRRLLVAAGWSATAIVAMIGPAACWSLVATLVRGNATGLNGIATWVPCLFYGSWFLWAIAAGAATRSYQLRSAHL